VPENFDHRVKQKAALVAPLDGPSLTRLRAGEIRLGDSEDLVYLAQGSPDEKKQTTTTSGETTAWVYLRYWLEYRGEMISGFQPRIRRDPATGSTIIYQEWGSRPVYTNRTQTVLRVTFTAGKVTAIERPLN
jgi:hypothetical protein